MVNGKWRMVNRRRKRLVFGGVPSPRRTLNNYSPFTIYHSLINEHRGVVGVAHEVAEEDAREHLGALGREAGVGRYVPSGADAVGGEHERRALGEPVRPDAHVL